MQPAAQYPRPPRHWLQQQQQQVPQRQGRPATMLLPHRAPYHQPLAAQPMAPAQTQPLAPTGLLLRAKPPAQPALRPSQLLLLPIQQQRLQHQQQLTAVLLAPVQQALLYQPQARVVPTQVQRLGHPTTLPARARLLVTSCSKLLKALVLMVLTTPQQQPARAATAQVATVLQVQGLHLLLPMQQAQVHPPPLLQVTAALAAPRVVGLLLQDSPALPLRPVDSCRAGEAEPRQLLAACWLQRWRAAVGPAAAPSQAVQGLRLRHSQPASRPRRKPTPPTASATVALLSQGQSSAAQKRFV